MTEVQDLRADVFVGVSLAGLVTPAMVKSMARKPVTPKPRLAMASTPHPKRSAFTLLLIADNPHNTMANSTKHP